jgi:hypothetical protein
MRAPGEFPSSNSASQSSSPSRTSSDKAWSIGGGKMARRFALKDSVKPKFPAQISTALQPYEIHNCWP